MLIAQRPTLSEEVVADHRSRFSLEPLEPGFGYTLGNSLRRTLLSSIPGAAVTSIRVDGVLHEFSTIPGVTEDVTEIILNLKQLVVSIEHDEPVTMYLRKQGPGEVTAADIAPPAGVEVHNPELEHRHAQRQGQARHGADRRARPRLRLRRAEQDRRRRDRPDAGRLDLLARCSRSPTRSRRPVSSSAPTSTGWSSTSRPSRRMLPRDAMASAGKTLVELFGLARELNVEAEGIDIGPSPVDAAAGRRPGAADRGPPPDGAVLQLPQARGHPHRGRAGVAQRAGPARHPQLRLEVDRRGQGQAGRAWACRSRTARPGSTRAPSSTSSTTTRLRGGRAVLDRVDARLGREHAETELRIVSRPPESPPRRNYSST